MPVRRLPDGDQLSLNFIAHHGVVQEIKVRQFTKCAGVMVVAHRLLKNRIAANEYILATSSCLDASKLQRSAGALAWQRSIDEYPAIGTIHYEYAPLADIRRSIADPPPRISPVTELGDDFVAVDIDAPILAVHQLVIDLDRRPEWLTAVERLTRPPTTVSCCRSSPPLGVFRAVIAGERRRHRFER